MRDAENFCSGPRSLGVCGRVSCARCKNLECCTSCVDRETRRCIYRLAKEHTQFALLQVHLLFSLAQQEELEGIDTAVVS